MHFSLHIALDDLLRHAADQGLRLRGFSLLTFYVKRWGGSRTKWRQVKIWIKPFVTIKKQGAKKKFVSVCHWQRVLLNSKSCAVSSDVIQKPFKKAIFIFFFFFFFWRDYFAERDGKRRKRKFRRELNDLRPSSRSRAGELFVWSNVAGMTFQVEWPNCRRCCWNTGDHHRLWWWSNNSSLVIRRWFPANDMASVMCNRLGWMWVAPHHHHQRREDDFNTQHDNSVVYVRKPLEITVRIYSPVSLSCNCGPFFKNRNGKSKRVVGWRLVSLDLFRWVLFSIRNFPQAGKRQKEFLQWQMEGG